MLRPDLAPLDAYLGDAISLRPEVFLERYPWPVLVIPEPSSDVLSRIRRPETVINEAAVNTLTSEIKVGASLTGASLDALCLMARPKRGTASNRVSMGRSPDADIVFLDESVSRFHAELSWGGSKENCVLTDLGAKNHTWLDGVQLAPQVRADLFSGAVVVAGSLAMRFYTPTAFLNWLSQGAPRFGAAPGSWPER